jgi:hypothetical protein
LANIARDRSVFTASRTLLSVALQKRPAFASYALNLAHVYENMCDLPGAMTVITQFLRDNAKVRIGKRGPSCSHLADAIEQVNDFAVVSSGGVSSRLYIKWVHEADSGHCEVVEVNSDGSISVERAAGADTAGDSKEEYSDNELDLLAIGFTAVKILYHMGNLSVLPGLYKVIEPVRLSSATSIHLTSIRNEHAYYQCIGQVLASRVEESSAAGASSSSRPEDDPPFEAVNAAFSDPQTQNETAFKNPIYFCGDSHTIPAAWSLVSVNSQQRMLVPKLVTGVKQWHLRKKSDFYPKAHFFNTVKSIPDGSEVCQRIFCAALSLVTCGDFGAGDIQCRRN